MTEDSPVRDEEAVRRFVEQIAMQFAEWGFPRMAARVLFALMTADEPGLTAGELGERLDASAAAISGAVRYLGQLRLVVREPVPGSRRDLYRLADNAWYVSASAEMGLYKSLIATSESVLDALGGPRSPARARVAEMRDFLLFLQDEMAGLLEKWNATRAAG
jgi:DNA-binding transcriptional regulator GbsR (MarR family)